LTLIFDMWVIWLVLKSQAPIVRVRTCGTSLFGRTFTSILAEHMLIGCLALLPPHFVHAPSVFGRMAVAVGQSLVMVQGRGGG